MKSKIMVIENQLVQYTTLKQKLVMYAIYPSTDDEYFQVMDWVRIILNNRYQKDRQAKVTEFLTNYIREQQIELFIIDYKLSSSHDGDNGIALAALLQSLFTEIPVIFLSGQPFNTKQIQDEVQVIKKWTWIEKGYAGVSLLQSDYIERNLIVKIKELLTKETTEYFIQLLEELLTKKTLVAYYDKLNNLKKDSEKGFVSSDQQFIKELHENAGKEESVIKGVFKKFGK